jgi:hypothetical protein
MTTKEMTDSRGNENVALPHRENPSVVATKIIPPSPGLIQRRPIIAGPDGETFQPGNSSFTVIVLRRQRRKRVKESRGNAGKPQTNRTNKNFFFTTREIWRRQNIFIHFFR